MALLRLSTAVGPQRGRVGDWRRYLLSWIRDHYADVDSFGSTLPAVLLLQR